MCRRVFLMLAILLPIASRAATGQVWHVQAGGSTLSRAGGALVEFWTPGAEGWFSLGVADGTRAGGMIRYGLGGYVLEVGDSELPLRLPTDGPGATSHFPGRGVSVARAGRRLSWRTFAGATSIGYSTQFFRAASMDRPLGFFQFDLNVTPSVRIASRTALSMRQTSLNAIVWKPDPGLEVGMALGIGANEPYLAGSTMLERKHVSLRASFVHATDGFRRLTSSQFASAEPAGGNVSFVLRPVAGIAVSAGRHSFLAPADPDARPGSERRPTIHYGSLHFGHGPFRTSVSGYDSPMGKGRTQGTSTSLGVRFDRFDVDVSGFRSWPAVGTRTTSVSGTVRESLSRRIELLQVVTHSAGNTSISFGGSLLTNPVTATVEYQTIFIPLDATTAFRQVLVAGLQAQPFGNVTLHAGTQILPDGRVEYTLRAGTFLYAGSARAQRSAPARMPRFLVRGRVVDADGVAIRGIALRIGDELVFTDSRGEFFLRTTRRVRLPVRVSTEEAVSRDRFEVVSEPDHAWTEAAEHAIPLHIVIRRVSRLPT